jgi:phosphoribosylglycinamide formyltransferase-1
MIALAEACLAQAWPARISAVVSNRPDAKGLAYARSAGIATEVIEHGQFADRQHYDEALMARIDAYRPDLVLLAGFMRILTPGFVSHYAGRLLNIHPSLLPAFTGLHTHRRALQAGVKVHGATVHFVTAELDCGPIVLQAVVPVHGADDEETLAARVLKLEHQIYPRAVSWFIEDRLEVVGNRVSLRGEGQTMSLGLKDVP